MYLYFPKLICQAQLLFRGNMSLIRLHFENVKQKKLFVLFCTHHTDLGDTRDDEFIDKVILSASFTEKEIDFFLVWNVDGSDEGRIYGRQRYNVTEIFFLL